MSEATCGFGDVPLWCLGEQPRTEAERDPDKALNTGAIGASGREYKGEREESSGLTEANSNLRRKPREVSS